VTDDLGTEYRVRSANGGGSDRFWQAISEFHPAPPPAARHLLLWSPATHPAGVVDVALR
jgi:hypothetical protein